MSTPEELEWEAGYEMAIEAMSDHEKWADHAYAQGYEAGHKHGWDEGRVEGYREGYNDHAASRAKGEAMFGAYTQHGQGENP